MTDKEYKRIKRECLLDFCTEHNYYLAPEVEGIFGYAFDRAYALGKEKETITQEEIEKTAEKYTERAYYPVGQSDCHEGFHMEAEECLAKAFKAGANFALGKKKEAITQEEIKKAAEKYSQSLGKSRDVTWNDGEYGFIAGANFALGKKIGISEFYDTEDTVIQGWVCRDKKDSALNLHAEKPYRTQSGYDVGYEPDWWESDCASFLPLDKNLFPDLTWDSDPEPVEIIIKRKKK